MSDAPSPLSRQKSVGNCASIRFRRIAPLNSSASAAASNPAATASAAGCSDVKLIRTQSISTTSSGSIRSRPASPLMTGVNGGLRSFRATPCRSPETTSDPSMAPETAAPMFAATVLVTCTAGSSRDVHGVVLFLAFQIGGLRPDNPLAVQKSLHDGFAVVERRPLHRAREFVARDAFNRKPYGNAVVYIVRKLIERSEPFPFDILHLVTFR